METVLKKYPQSLLGCLISWVGAFFRCCSILGDQLPLIPGRPVSYPPRKPEEV